MSNKQVQKTGDNSTLIQVSGDLNVGITEERAREICHEMLAKEIADLVVDANNKAQERAVILENKLINKIEECNDLLRWFDKPEFLYLVRSAQKSAIQTDRDHDYDLLVNLLLNKTKRENDRKFGTGVKQAIEIVNDIDDDSLKALTILFIHETYSSNGNNIFEILDAMDQLYEKIGVNDLPIDPMWMDQLDILKCIRLSDVSSFMKLEDYYIKKYESFLLNGIKIESPQYTEAMDILRKNDLPSSVLTKHELNPDYVRLNLANDVDINSLFLVRGGISKESLTEEQKDALRKILTLCTKHTSTVTLIKEKLVSEIEKRPSLSAVKKWINELGHFGQLTCVGKVIAFTEAKMKYHDLPDIFE